jgi:hypothetical protein
MKIVLQDLLSRLKLNNKKPKLFKLNRLKQLLRLIVT